MYTQLYNDMQLYLTHTEVQLQPMAMQSGCNLSDCSIRVYLCSSYVPALSENSYMFILGNFEPE